MSYRLMLILSLAFFSGCQKKKAPEISDFADLYSISSRFDKESSVLAVDIVLDKKIHAYAEGEKSGIPLRLEVNPKNGWQLDGAPELPKGKLKKLESLGESVVLEGDIRIRQKLKKGQGKGEANLYLQVCGENTCDRPRVHPLSFE